MATAGLSESAADCRADNWPFYIGFALFVLFCVWITLSMFATVDVISRYIGPSRSATWVGVVWLVRSSARPLGAFHAAARRPLMSTRTRIASSPSRFEVPIMTRYVVVPARAHQPSTRSFWARILSAYSWLKNLRGMLSTVSAPNSLTCSSCRSAARACTASPASRMVRRTSKGWSSAATFAAVVFDDEIRAAVDARRDADALLDAAVAKARQLGRSWADIGAAIGTTRQSANERWKDRT